MSAASKAKRENPDLSVIVFEKGGWVSYVACEMLYHIKGKIGELTVLVGVTAEEFQDPRDIDLHTNHIVVSINPEEKTVTVRTTEGTFTQE